MIHFHDQMVRRLHEEIGARANELMHGAPIDYAHYREVVGILQGLRLALEISDVLEGEILKEGTL